MLTIYTVTQINNHCKNVLESQFTKVWIKGEVSSPQIYSSGHLYFTLKDDTAQLSCVYFNYSNNDISDGDEITVNGNISLYSLGGKYQLIAIDYFHSGQGALFKKFNHLKKKLLSEGLFDKKHKKPLPLFPNKIGIITSSKGSVIKDIINILNRRAPYINIFIRDCHVQGKDSSKSIIDSISDFEKFNQVDLLIIARGGGSFEDLMPFNDERLIRKIFSLTIPVVSSIGHETDYTLCDFVADIRASTPSEAAEIISIDKKDLMLKFDSLLKKIENNLYLTFNSYFSKIDILKAKIPSHPKFFIDNKVDLLNYNIKIINNKIIVMIDNYISYLNSRIEFLNLSNPENLIKKGYSLIKINNKIINDIKMVKEKDLIDIDMYKGQIKAIIKKINRI